MSEIEPHKRGKKELAPPHFPQMVVPIAYADVRQFVRDAVRPTSLVNSYAQLATPFALFEPHLRFTAVDAAHTRIEIDESERVAGAGVLLFTWRRGAIDRFFVAIQDELDRRARYRTRPSDGDGAIESGG